MKRIGILCFVVVVLIFPLALSTQAEATDLFISEYIEGSGNNKALEIFNGTGASVNLSSYLLEFYPNGVPIPSVDIDLVGTLANGDVFVIAHPSANAAILAQADETDTALANFNGNDAIVLRKSGVGVIDTIGEVGFDPGTEWGSGLTSTADNTLVRKPAICEGDAIDDDPFDPSVEWNGFDNDTFSFIGFHVSECIPANTATPTSPPTNTPLPTHTPSNTPPPTNTPGGPTDTPTNTAAPTDTLTPTNTPTTSDSELTATAGGDTLTPTNTLNPTETATDPGSSGVELVANGGFEDKQPDNDPELSPWEVKNGTGDKIKCNKDKDGDGIPDKIVAHTGECAFRFKGAIGEASKLRQNMNLTGIVFNQGDTLNLSVYVDAPKNSASGKIKVRVKYNDADTDKITRELTKTTGYEQQTGVVTIDSVHVTKIKLQIDHKSSSSKVHIDSVSLLWVEGSSGLIPLPPAP